MTIRNAHLTCVLCLCLACGRKTDSIQGQASASPSSVTKPPNTSQATILRPTSLVEPTVLAQMPISAYHVSLALDGAIAYLLTGNGAFRLVSGQPPQGIQLDLGIGSVLTQSAFIFWSKGHIWRAPKEGGVTRPLAKFPHQPQYFVASGDELAWIDQSDEGLYTIQALERGKPRVLVSSTRELSSLTMIQDALYFVETPTDTSWRVGVLRISSGQPEYGPERKGRRPAMLSASESIYYYDVDKSEIRRLINGVQQDETLLGSFVCSPIYVSSRIYCGCMEGLFDLSKEARKPRVLYANRVGIITGIVANEEMVVWTSDAGAEKLTVSMLAVDAADAKAAP
jgi:hypothetical protein